MWEYLGAAKSKCMKVHVKKDHWFVNHVGAGVRSKPCADHPTRKARLRGECRSCGLPAKLPFQYALANPVDLAMSKETKVKLQRRSKYSVLQNDV